MIATVLGLIFVLIILGVIFWGAQQLLAIDPVGRAVSPPSSASCW